MRLECDVAEQCEGADVAEQHGAACVLASRRNCESGGPHQVIGEPDFRISVKEVQELFGVAEVVVRT